MGEKIKLFLPLFIAASRGEIIQKSVGNRWEDTEEIDWTKPVESYRIKPEITYRPFTFEEMKTLRDKWIVSKHEKNGALARLNILVEQGIVIDGDQISYGSLLKDFQFEDGTPCGVLVE